MVVSKKYSLQRNRNSILFIIDTEDKFVFDST